MKWIRKIVLETWNCFWLFCFQNSNDNGETKNVNFFVSSIPNSPIVSIFWDLENKKKTTNFTMILNRFCLLFSFSVLILAVGQFSHSKKNYDVFLFLKHEKNYEKNERIKAKILHLQTSKKKCVFKTWHLQIYLMIDLDLQQSTT